MTHGLGLSSQTGRIDRVQDRFERLRGECRHGESRSRVMLAGGVKEARGDRNYSQSELPRISSQIGSRIYVDFLFPALAHCRIAQLADDRKRCGNSETTTAQTRLDRD